MKPKARTVSLAGGDVRHLQVIRSDRARVRLAIFDADGSLPLIHAELTPTERRALIRALRYPRAPVRSPDQLPLPAA